MPSRPVRNPAAASKARAPSRSSRGVSSGSVAAHSGATRYERGTRARAGEDRFDETATIERELNGLAHAKIREHRPLRSEAKHLDGVRSLVERLKPRSIGETIECSREVGLDGRRASDVDLSTPERVDDGAAIAVEADLDPPKPRRATHVARERGERHAESGDPRRDRERTRMHRLALVLRALVLRRAGEDMHREHARDQWVQIPSLPGAIR
jgi:hypothetical protein